MRRKKLGIVGIECRIQKLLYTRHVDFSVFDERMVSVDQNGDG